MAKANIVCVSAHVKSDEAFAKSIVIDPERFWSKVRISDEPTACWEWQAALDPKGYGRFSIGVSRNAVMLAHRVSFGLANGYLPEAVCHRCDNPPCCNPAHLMPGDRIFNNRDKAAKGRGRCGNMRGENHPQAKISGPVIEEIRRSYNGGGTTQRQLAARFGVSQRTIAKAIQGLHVGFGNGSEAHS